MIFFTKNPILNSEKNAMKGNNRGFGYLLDANMFFKT